MMTKGECHAQFEKYMSTAVWQKQKKDYFDGVRRYFEKWCKDKLENGLFGPDMVFEFHEYLFTILYVGYVLKDRDFELDDVREDANEMTWSQYLDWRTNDLYNLTKSFVQEVEEEKIQETIPIIRRKLIDNLDSKSKEFMKACDTLLKMGGRDKGKLPVATGLKVTVVRSYAEEEGQVDAVSVTAVKPETKVLSDGLEPKPKTA